MCIGPYYVAGARGSVPTLFSVSPAGYLFEVNGQKMAYDLRELEGKDVEFINSRIKLEELPAWKVLQNEDEYCEVVGPAGAIMPFVWARLETYATEEAIYRRVVIQSPSDHGQYWMIYLYDGRGGKKAIIRPV